MHKFYSGLTEVLKQVDIVLEVRDARFPFSTVNPNFNKVLNGELGQSGWLTHGSSTTTAHMKSKGAGDTERLVVYSKREWAEQKYEKPLTKAFKKHYNQTVMFANSKDNADVKRVLVELKKFAAHRFSPETPVRILVVGMPNVGKSSLLNGLRRIGDGGKNAFSVSSKPGWTRAIHSDVVICRNPQLRVLDSPGVMVPNMGAGRIGAERGLKLALAGQSFFLHVLLWLSSL